MVKIITVATEKKFYFKYLESTCKDFGGDFVCLGYGERWGGYSWKFKKMISYLASIPPNEFVVFVDGYDVICVKDLSTITEKYKKVRNETNCKLLIASDRSMLLPRFISWFYFGSINGVLINSGTYLGFAGEILEILTKAVKQYPDENDDQVLITNYAKNCGNEICIDVDQQFFYAVGDSMSELPSPPVNKNPYFIHAYGCGFLTNILINMGYIVDDSIKQDLRKEFFKKLAYHITVLIKRNIYIVILVIILTVFIVKKYK